VVFSAYQTLNHVAAVRFRSLAGLVSRYVRVFAVLVMLLARPAPVRALWLGAVLGAAAVTVVLNAGPLLLASVMPKRRAGSRLGSTGRRLGRRRLRRLQLSPRSCTGAYQLPACISVPSGPPGNEGTRCAGIIR
jgi:hypothetical protein